MKSIKIASLRIHIRVEIIFDIAYLLFALITGISMIFWGKEGNTPLFLFGILTLVLGCGDAFHLIPRVYAQITDQMNTCTKSLGFGKLVTSITMTVFYLLLYGVWVSVSDAPFVNWISVVLSLLAILRIALCLCPQNRWFEKTAPLSWAIYRNIPFLIIGIIVIILYASTSWVSANPFRFMPIAVTLSFLFYLPVVLFSQKNPKIGALMLPKTMAYIWIIFMGLGLK